MEEKTVVDSMNEQGNPDLDETVGFTEESFKECGDQNKQANQLCSECKERQEEVNSIQKQMKIIQNELQKKNDVILKHQQEISRRKKENKEKEKIIKRTTENQKQLETNYSALKTENHRLSVECMMAKENMVILRERLEDARSDQRNVEALSLIRDMQSPEELRDHEEKDKNSKRLEKQCQESRNGDADQHNIEVSETDRRKMLETTLSEKDMPKKFEKVETTNEQSEKQDKNKIDETSKGSEYVRTIDLKQNHKPEEGRNLTGHTHIRGEIDVNRKKSDEQITELRVKIPKEKIGFIIGRGGWKTRSIQTATGTVIIHPNDRESDAFTIIGKKHDTDQAKQIILNMVQLRGEEKQRNMEKAPRRTSEPDQPKQCRYFLRGRCKFGNNCKFQHGLEEDMSGDRWRTWTNHRSSIKPLDNQYHKRNPQNDHRPRYENRREDRESEIRNKDRRTWDDNSNHQCTKNRREDEENESRNKNRGTWNDTSNYHYIENRREGEESEFRYKNRRTWNDNRNHQYTARMKRNESWEGNRRKENRWQKGEYDRMVDHEDKSQYGQENTRDKFFRLTRNIPDVNIKEALTYVMEILENKY